MSRQWVTLPVGPLAAENLTSSVDRLHDHAATGQTGGINEDRIGSHWIGEASPSSTTELSKMRYEVKSNPFGKPTVKFNCSGCGVRLTSPITDAGEADTCPDCRLSILVPGIAERKKYEEALDRRKSELASKKEAKQRAKDELIAAKEAAIRESKIRERNALKEQIETDRLAKEYDVGHTNAVTNLNLTPYAPHGSSNKKSSLLATFVGVSMGFVILTCGCCGVFGWIGASSPQSQSRARQTETRKHASNNQDSAIREFSNAVGSIEGAGILIEQIKSGSTDGFAVIVVTNYWHQAHRQNRLQLAQKIQYAWAKTYAPDDADRAYIKIVDLNGNVVGKSGIFGSSVSVID